MANIGIQDVEIFSEISSLSCQLWGNVTLNSSIRVKVAWFGQISASFIIRAYTKFLLKWPFSHCKCEFWWLTGAMWWLERSSNILFTNTCHFKSPRSFTFKVSFGPPSIETWLTHKYGTVWQVLVSIRLFWTKALLTVGVVIQNVLIKSRSCFHMYSRIFDLTGQFCFASMLEN